MAKIINSLRKLGEKCIAEGHEVTGRTIGDVLDCIATHWEGGGGGSTAPAVEWIDITPDEDMTTFTMAYKGASIDAAGIYALASADKNVIGRVIRSEEISPVQLYSSGEDTVVFTQLSLPDSESASQMVVITSDNHGNEINIIDLVPSGT